MDEFRRLGRGNPSRSKALRMNPRKLQEFLQEGHPFLSHDITTLVMTFADASASDKDTVCPSLKRLQHIMRRNGSGAHDPDNPDRRRILHPTDPSQVSGSISSPGAQKSNNFRSKLLCHSLPHECQMSKFKLQMKLKIQMVKKI